MQLWLWGLMGADRVRVIANTSVDSYGLVWQPYAVEPAGSPLQKLWRLVRESALVFCSR